MKKTLFFSLLIFYSLHAQIGINTQNPQEAFHIDAGKDNNITDVPTLSQQVNDIVITSNGNFGIGTIAPNSILQLNGSLSMPVVVTDKNYTLTDRDYSVIFNGLSQDAASHVIFTIPDPSTCKGRIYKITSLNGGLNGHSGAYPDTNEYGLALSIPVIYAKDDDGTVRSSNSVYKIGNSVGGTKGFADRITIQSDGNNWYCIDY